MATITWTGAAGDNNFNNPANWSPMQVPGSGDTAVISTSAAETVTVANTALGGLTLGSHDTLSIDDNQSLTIGSGTGSTTLSIAGTLLLNSTGDSTGLILADTLTMLTGGGQLVLNNTGYPNYVEGTAAANTLDNVNDTISGAGNFGNGQLTFVNGASGIFDANDSNALYLNTGTTSTNSGLIEATGTGGLVIESSVNNGTLGHVSAAGGVVSLNGKTIQGGTLSSSGAGKIDVNNGTLDGSANTVSNTGSVQVDDNQALYALGTIANTGTIEVDSTGDSTGFVVGSPTLTLTGAGTLTSSLQGYSNYIEGSSSGDTLVNASNIYFGGNFGNASTLSVVNSGVINASQAPALYLNLAATLTNDKLIEETAAGGITIDGNTTINNTSGTISAIGTGGVTLQNGADIMAGHLTSTGGTFYSNGGTLDGKTHGAVVTSAAIQVDDNQALYALGTLNNTGTITVASAGDSTGFVVDSSSVTLSGGGVVTTTGENNANFFEGAAAADVLDNANNTLDLSGNFGNGQLTFVNSGTLNANQTTGLTINTGGSFTNHALVEETGTGGIAIQSDTIVANAGGTIAATGAGGITLNGGTIQGGLLTSQTGQFYSNNGTLDGSTAGSVTSSGAFQVDDNNSLHLLGTIANSGTITIDSTGDSTGIYIDSGTVSLTGSGVVTTSGNGYANYFYGSTAGNVLDNVNNTLNISGNFGDGQLTFVNNYIVDADQSAALVLNTGGSFTNNDLVEETSSGGIYIDGNTAISNGSVGTVSATGTGGVTLANNATIYGGVLTSGTGGGFYSNNGTLNGASNTITSSAYIQVDDNNSLHLLGTVINTGTIAIDSTGDSTGIYVDSPTLTLTGGGLVTTSAEGYGNYFYGSTGGYTLDNVNNTFDISGNFGAGQLTFINGGTVSANQTATLYFNTGVPVINNALIEETSSGGIVIDSNTTISNGASGTIAVSGTGGLTLNGGTIEGGTLVGGAGTINSNNGTIDGLHDGAITSSANINVDDSNVLYMLGTIANSGTITIDSTGDSTGLYIDSGTVSLTGGGVLTTSGAGNANFIYGANAGNTLNNVNNTLNLSGNFGAGQLTFINNYIVDANQGASLVLNTGGSFTNNDLVEETSTGGIVIDSNTTVSNGAHGTFAATGTGGVTVNGGTIAGGVLTSGAGGGFYFNNGVLSGVSNTVTSSAYIQADDNARLYAAGTISNSGTIEVNSTGDSTGFYVDSPTLTLTGGGTVTTSNDGYNNYFYANTGGDVLNNVDNTFNISGNFGDGSGLAVVNGGTFVAGQSSELYLNTGATFLNNGQLIASGSGGLDLRSVILTNGSTGTIAAMSGSTLVSESGGTLTNDSSAGTLSAGTYAAIAGASAATLNFNGHAVVTLNANAVLSGTGSEISFGGVAIETDLSQISKTGELQVLGNRAYTSKKILTNNGNLVLGGGSFHPYALSNSSSGTISGFGTIAAKLTDNGALVATGGALELLGSGTAIDGAVSGSGTLSIGGTTTLGTKTTLSVSDIVLLSKSSLDLGTSVSFAGTFNVTGTAALAGPGTFTNTGLFESTGKGVGTISAPVSSSGTIETAANTTLAFSGGLTNTGLILDNGVFTDTAALTGGSMTLSKTSKATIASTVGSPNSTLATLTSAGGALNTSNTTITVTGDYNNTAAGSGNSYNPFAGVTGTIDANGTQLAVVGVDGTTISNVNGTLTIAIASGGTAHFVIENAGPSGDTLLRGALQTSVNGGSITTSALSGSGVKAGNYGPVAGGSSTGTYAISYNGSTPLTGQAIHIASDFANVAGVTIDIVASNPAAPALGTTVSSEPAASTAWVPSLHHG